MKRHLASTVSALALGVSAVLCLATSSAGQVPGGADRPVDREQISAILARWEDAWNRHDMAAFASLFHDDGVFRIEGDYAIVMGLETLVPNADAPHAGLVAGRVVQRRFTNIWRKEAGSWQLFARHANVIVPR